MVHCVVCMHLSEDLWCVLQCLVASGVAPLGWCCCLQGKILHLALPTPGATAVAKFTGICKIGVTELKQSPM